MKNNDSLDSCNGQFDNNPSVITTFGKINLPFVPSLSQKEKGQGVSLSFLLFIIALLLAMGISEKGFAATITSNVVTGDWSATGSWVGGVVPGSLDDVIIATGANITVNINNAACLSMQVNSGGAPGTATLTFASGSILTIGGSLTAGGNNAAKIGSIIMTAGGTIICNSIGNPLGAAWTPGTGTLQLAATNTLPATVFTTFNNLQINSGTTTLAANITVSTALTVKAGATLANAGFTIGTPTSVTLENSNAAVGGIISGAGQLTLGGNVSVTVLAAGPITTGATISCPVALGATRTFNIADDASTTNTDFSISGIVSGATFGITKSTGTGTMALSGVNTFTGITTINAGKLSVGTIGNGGVAGNLGQAAAAAANLVLGGGTLQYTGATASTDRAFTLTAATTSSIEITVGANTLTMSGAGAATSGSLTKIGTGTLLLSGANAYTGATTVNGGTLKAGVVTSAFGITSAVTLANTSGVVLDITGFNNTIGSLTGGGATGGNVTLGAATLTIGSDNSSPAAYAGVISGSGGAIIKSGTGTLTLSGANNYTGVTTLNAGQLNINNASAIGTGTFTIAGGTIDNSSGGSITLSTNNVQNWNGDFTFTGTQALNLGTGAVTMNANRTVTVSASTLTVGGTINHSTLNLIKAGAGTLSFGSSANNVTLMDVTVNAGILTLNSSTGVTTFNTVTINSDAGAVLNIPSASANSLVILQ